MNPKIRLNSRLLPLLVGLAAVMQIVDPSRIWLALLIGLGGAWLLAYLWARELARGIRLLREMRFGWAQVGDRLEERFTLLNKSWVPALWVELVDGSNLPGYETSRVTGVGGQSQNQWRTEGVCTQRGVYTLGPTDIILGDPLGFYSVRIHDPAATTLMVMPPIVPLPAIQVAPGGISGEGRPRANAPERTVSASTVREYTPGDSLRLIHWPTSARKEKPYVRLLDGTPAGDWWIFLDLYKEAQAGHGWDSTVEHGVILAASLADRGLSEGKSVGLVVNGEQLAWLPPRGGEIQRLEILRALATARPGEHPLAELLERNQRGIRQYTSLVLITPDIGGRWVEALIPLLWRGVVPTSLVLDPLTFGSPFVKPDQLPALLETLTDLGVAHYSISRDMLDRPEARPGREGEWEFRVSATGRAVAVRRPSNLAWKTLS